MKQGTGTTIDEFHRLSSSGIGPNYFGPTLFNDLPTTIRELCNDIFFTEI